MARTKIRPENAPNGKVQTVAELGAWVRYLRKANGITLVDAAALCGVGVRFLLELEHGKQGASLGKALQVLERMGLDLTIHPRGKR